MRASLSHCLIDPYVGWSLSIIDIVPSKASPLSLRNSRAWLQLHLWYSNGEVAKLLVSDAVSAASCLLEIQEENG